MDSVPFIAVITSARCKALIMEKCPLSSASSVFCLSTPMSRFRLVFDDKDYIIYIYTMEGVLLGSPTISLEAPLTAFALFDMIDKCSARQTVSCFAVKQRWVLA